MKFAVIKLLGKQFKVKEGDELLIDRTEGKPKSKLKFDQVLLVVDGEKVTLGQPEVKNASVSAEIIEQLKGKKIRVATYKAKSRYRRVKGHRSHLTRVKILRIVTRENKAPTKSK